MARNKTGTTVSKAGLTAIITVALTSGSAQLHAGDREDRADKAMEASIRAAERATRDSARASEEAARAAERTRIDEIKTTEDGQRAEVRAAEDLAKAQADAQEQAIKDAADAEEQAAKDAADAADDAAKAAEDAAKDAADAAEDAAKAAEDAMEDSHGSSETMRDLASSESPDFDGKGFPVRNGEIVGIDVDERSVGLAVGAGFTVIERTKLPGLGSEVIRFAAPKGMDSSTALELMRSTDAQGSYDMTHYYGLLFSPQGGPSAKSGSAIKAKAGTLKIGMIDTGVAGHKALSKLSLMTRDFSGNNKAVPTEHGTAIASLLASEGAATIYAANIFQSGIGKPYTSADAIVRALDWMVQQQVPVINISLAGPRNKILDALVRKASTMGHVIVAAAGNGGPTAPPAYPAALPDVVAVTAVDKNLRVYRYANQGKYVRVAALGVDIAAATPGGKTGRQSGTSFATPHVAAWMARCTGSKNPTTRLKCIKRLESEARDLGEPGRDAVYGYGFIS
ncbi:S8 family serine peptidase [Sphingorhabdus pulchriflava]|nr:S8 family serine peptidase [Sphingorhabdus pulchriflava]